jgi:hypothetical protein
MDKMFGVKGQISNFPFNDLKEIIYEKDGIEIEIDNSTVLINVEDEAYLETAMEIARIYLLSYSIRQNIKMGVNFNQKWKLNANKGKEILLELSDKIKLTDRVHINSITSIATLKGTARIITKEMYDSASFSNDSLLVEKALKYPFLKKVLSYLGEEVIDEEKPLYGIYKALELITHNFEGQEKNQGRKKLAELIGKGKKYVDDIMETTQIQRHAVTQSSRKLSDIECKQRAKILIDAFCKSLI